MSKWSYGEYVNHKLHRWGLPCSEYREPRSAVYVFRPTDSCRLSIKVSLTLCVSVVFTFLTFNVAGNFYDFPCCLENVCEAFARALLPFEKQMIIYYIIIRQSAKRINYSSQEHTDTVECSVPSRSQAGEEEGEHRVSGYRCELVSRSLHKNVRIENKQIIVINVITFVCVYGGICLCSIANHEWRMLTFHVEIWNWKRNIHKTMRWQRYTTCFEIHKQDE